MPEISLRRLLAAVLLLAIYVALGLIVTKLPVGELDRAETFFAGRGVGAAIVLTRAGTFPVYLALGSATIAIGLFARVAPSLFGLFPTATIIGRRSWFGCTLVIVGALLLSWVSSDLFKELFHRVRPEHWYYVHETSFAYSSGHATLSLVFYGSWGYLLSRTLSPSGWRTAIVTVLGCWIAAIGWSRLVLGAHYPTDVLGGYLLGAVWLVLSMTAIDYLLERRLAAT